MSGCHCMGLRRATERVVRFYDDAVAPSGVTLRQYTLLRRTALNAGCSVTQLACEVGLDPSTLARSLRPLITRGLVEDRKAKGARNSRLFLTDEGERVRAQAADLWEQAQEDFERRLGPERIAAFTELVSALEEL